MSENPISYNAYQELALYYDRYVDEKPYNALYERPNTLALLPEVSAKDVLDAGCAAGWYTAWLAEHGARVTAVDFSPNMVAAAQRRVGDRAVVHQADLNYPLDFLPDRSFDLIVSSLALHYLKDLMAAFHEFWRLLRPGGTFVFSMHHPFMDYVHFSPEDYFGIRLVEDEWNTPQGPVTVHFFRRPLYRILDDLLGARFTLEKLAEPMPDPRMKELFPEIYKRLTHKPQFLFIRARKI